MSRPRTFNESEVIRQAREVFHDRGYAGTSVEELTNATGLQRSSLYGAFEDKHGLFLRAFEQYCDEEIGRVEEQLDGDPAGAFARLRKHLRTKAAEAYADSRGCLLARAAAEMAAEDPPVAKLATDSYARYQRALTKCVHQAQDAGEIRPELDPAATGAMLLAVLRGIEALGRAGQPRASLRAMADTALASVAAPGIGTSSAGGA